MNGIYSNARSLGWASVTWFVSLAISLSNISRRPSLISRTLNLARASGLTRGIGIGSMIENSKRGSEILNDLISNASSNSGMTILHTLFLSSIGRRSGFSNNRSTNPIANGTFRISLLTRGNALDLLTGSHGVCSVNTHV